MQVVQKWIPVFSINGVLFIVSWIFACFSVSSFVLEYMPLLIFAL
jgi:hypothetical protein